MEKIAVYTALFGDYDELIEPPEKFEGCDFICFTDQTNLTSETWDIRVVSLDGLSPHMMNRKYKFFPNVFLDEYNNSIYIDANIELIHSPLDLFKYSLENYDIAVPKHTVRKCVYEEAEIVRQRGLDCPIVISKQMSSYASSGMPKGKGLGEMNIIFRRHHNGLVVKVMDEWWVQINKYSSRDQLSFMYCSWRYGLKVNLINESSRLPSQYFFAYYHKNSSSFKKFKRYVKRRFYKIAYGY